MLWIRSYWVVDAVWVQFLPHWTLEIHLTPGQLATCGSRSTARLPVGDSDWYRWPVDNYFAADIPRPSHPILGQLGFYNDNVKIPLWMLVLGAGSLQIAAYPWQRQQKIAVKSGRPATYTAEPLSPSTGGSLLLRDHPLVAPGPAPLTPQNAAVMHVA